MPRPAKNGGTAVEAFPVKLLKNYRPMGEFTILEHEDPGDLDSPLVERRPRGKRAAFKDIPGEYPGDDPIPHTVRAATDEWAKVKAGTIVKLPLDEARTVISKRIAERGDAIP